MEFNFREGTEIIKNMKVTYEDTAVKMGSGDLEVYATPAMVAFMENTAKDSILKYIPDGYTTVGIEMNVKHIKSSPVGANIKCRAVLSKVDRKKLFFHVQASDDSGIIGEAHHVRYVVNKHDFMVRTNMSQ